jgi:putative oxidoreductase
MKRALSLVLRLGLGALFVLAGALKLRDPSAFATAIANYQLLPGLAALLAATLPATEIVVGLTVVVGSRPWRQGATVAIGLLTLMFTAAAAAALARGIDISCGCFGVDSGAITAWTIVRDVALVAACALLLLLDRRAPGGYPGSIQA